MAFVVLANVLRTKVLDEKKFPVNTSWSPHLAPAACKSVDALLPASIVYNYIVVEIVHVYSCHHRSVFCILWPLIYRKGFFDGALDLKSLATHHPVHIALADQRPTISGSWSSAAQHEWRMAAV